MNQMCKRCGNEILRIVTRKDDIELFGQSGLSEDEAEVTIITDQGHLTVIVDKKKLIEDLQ